MKARVNKTKQNKIVTLKEAEQALSVALRDAGKLFPQTKSDVEKIVEEVDTDRVASPDLNKFRVSLRHRSPIRVPRLPPDVRRPEEEVVADLRAARNGNEIPENIFQRMRADREAAEKEQLEHES
jgi:hypothetical protein